MVDSPQNQTFLTRTVSLFQNVFHNDNPAEITVEAFLKAVKQGKYRQQIESLRALKADPTAYDEAKKKLAGVTLSAQLTTRKKDVDLCDKLIAHSGLIQIDVDKLEDLQAFRQRIDADQYTAFSFISPGGDGLKVGVRINPTRHDESWDSAAAYYLKQYGQKIDPKVKEVPRLLFASYDPDVFVNPEAKIFPVIQNGNGARPQHTESRETQDPLNISDAQRRHGERALDTARKMIEQSKDGEKLNDLLKAGNLLGGYVAGGMLAESEAKAVLRKAIEVKPTVRNFKTAYDAIDDSIQHGKGNPIAFEDLERQRKEYLDRMGFRPREQSTAQPKDPPKQTADSGPLQFPVDVMSGAADEFARIYSSCTEAPIQFYYVSYLTCLGNILADRLTIESQISPQPRLFTLLLGESADDRKSTAIDQTVKFFGQIVEQNSFNVCHGVGSAEGLQKRLEKCNRLILCFDEFKQFVSKCKIEASVLLPCVTSLFESNRYESRTKSSEICLEGVHLSVLAASTVQTYENTWTSQFTDIGFNNRLFLVTGSGKRRFSIPPKVSIENRNRLMYALRGILQQVPTKAELRIESDAQEAFHSWYMNTESSIHTKRLDTYALRFMPLLAVNDGKQSIDLETVNKVMRLCNWQLEVRKQHDPIDADNAIAKMEEKIRRVMASRGALSDRDLKRHSNASRAGLWLYEKAKRNLMAAREIRWSKENKKYVSL